MSETWIGMSLPTEQFKLYFGLSWRGLVRFAYNLFKPVSFGLNVARRSDKNPELLNTAGHNTTLADFLNWEQPHPPC